MAKRIAIVNPVGFDSLGCETLCLQYAMLGLPVYFKSENVPDRAVLDNVYTYQTFDQLINIANNYDRLLFINLWFGTEIPDNVFDDIIQLKETYPSIEYCYIYCMRSPVYIYKLLPYFYRTGFRFDRIFSIGDGLKSFKLCPVTIMRLNAVTLPDYSPADYSDRELVVFTSGRVAAIKGTVKYFNAINSHFLDNTNDFFYVHEGANFTFHKRDSGVSSSIVMMSLFDTSKHPKEVKPEYVFKSYDDKPEKHKLNIYPNYDKDTAIARWKNYFAGISCILGTNSRYVRADFLFDDDFVLQDKRENTMLEKSAILWNEDLEYADMEKLIAGVPLLFSKRYAKILGFTDERLIYNCFADIPDKVNNLIRYYDDARESQWQWFVRMTQETNNNILKIFTEDFNK